MIADSFETLIYKSSVLLLLVNSIIPKKLGKNHSKGAWIKRENDYK